MLPNYDVIVVGAGHAGCEAAMAAANLGSKVLLITMDLTKIAAMSCNPAIGGIAKGQIVREIDALGGYCGIVTDYSMLQFKMLNMSKGPAMWSPRAQCDRTMFILKWRSILESHPNVDLWQDTVTSLILQNDSVIGVKTLLDISIFSKTVILTNGTFLNGNMHFGMSQLPGGRISEPASYYLSDQLKDYGLSVGRMKTGTPVRIDGRTIDFSKSIVQPGDDTIKSFSYLPNSVTLKKQLDCYLVYTNEAVHDVLRKSFDLSPMYNGRITSIGPRYCPSIETKIVTFPHKNSHQLFLEPEGFSSCEYYLNGFSSSLPPNVQYEALKLIPGLETCKIFKPGYAIEYDYFDPTDLDASLESKVITNLFLAGQINGTTGYEEAAGQGLIAGINSHLKIVDKPKFTLKRNEAYIGVLIDDLITKGVDEPYRMFTSRAEYRTLLRQDNADQRLTEKSYNLGLSSEERYRNCTTKYNNVKNLCSVFFLNTIKPLEINSYLESKQTTPITQNTKISQLLSRPQVNIQDLISLGLPSEYNIYGYSKEEYESAEISIKYSGYIDKESTIAEKISRLDNIKLSPHFNYETLLSISTEARQKLSKIKPETIGQASRIPGISPSDINVLLLFLGR